MRSVPNSSTLNEASTVAWAIARRSSSSESSSSGLRGDVADEAARERVARAGRVDHRLQRIGRQREEALARDSAAPYSPCLATITLGAPAPRDLAADLAAATRFGLPVSWRSSASLRIRQSTLSIACDERVARDVDPQVHRVERDEARVGQLRAHLALQVGLDVGQEQHVAGARALRQLRLRSPRTRRAGCRSSRASSGPSRTRPARRTSCRPATRSMSSTSTPRRRMHRDTARSPKSSPTGPTTRTSVEERRGQREMRPRRRRASARARPNGVLTVS